MTVKIHTLGYPRIGANRELKKAVEAYWKGAIPRSELEGVGAAICSQNWLTQRDEVLAFVQARPEDGGSGAVVVLLKAKGKR